MKRYFHGTLLALCFASPALADVKAGVEAWTKGDFPSAVREWQGPADAGDADGQFNLGQAYKLGRGVRQDLGKAEDLFGKAAAQGHMQASDIYGLLLFQRGQHATAMPYIRSAADRGEPRAQYLLGVSHFNGDNVPKDWVRAYALVSLAEQTGLDQAKAAKAQMDNYIPLGQRQQAAALAGELAAQADQTRARQFAAADLGGGRPPASAPMPRPAPVMQAPYVEPPVAAAPPRPMQPRPAQPSYNPPAYSTPHSIDLHSNGADYARPAPPAPAGDPYSPPPVRPAPMPRPAPQAVAPAQSPAQYPAAAPAAASASGGAWRIQFGAFGVASNANALWARVQGRPEVAGHPRINAASGGVTRLLAGGYSETDARAACSRLSAAGITCVPTRN